VISGFFLRREPDRNLTILLYLKTSRKSSEQLHVYDNKQGINRWHVIRNASRDWGQAAVTFCIQFYHRRDQITLHDLHFPFINNISSLFTPGGYTWVLVLWVHLSPGTVGTPEYWYCGYTWVLVMWVHLSTGTVGTPESWYCGYTWVMVLWVDLSPGTVVTPE
jgi:hypothetical protein